MPNQSTPGIAFGESLDFGVTALCREVFAELASEPIDFDALADDSKTWRRNYTRPFAQAVPLEFAKNADQLRGRLLDRFLELARMSDGTSLEEAMATGWANPNLVELESIGGNGALEPIALPDSSWLADAEMLVSANLAEPGLLSAAKRLDTLQEDPRLPTLLAFAGGAELSGASHWLRWGGEVLLLARTSGEQLAQLKSVARTGGGKLWTIRAQNSVHEGIDLTASPHFAAAAICALLKQEVGANISFGHFGYAPGISHLRLQAVAEGLSRLLIANVNPDNLHFSWLATPTDSLAVTRGFAEERVRNWQSRSRLARALELPWRAMGYLQKPNFDPFEGEDGESLAVMDTATRLQGPSYSLAKRLQRWRAGLLRNQQIRVSYQITPPARTDSVLRHKILRATYRGAPKFGVIPFDAFSASIWPAALAALDATSRLEEDSGSSGDSSAVSWYFDQSIHGGLWRTTYQTSSIWVPATALGLVTPNRELN